MKKVVFLTVMVVVSLSVKAQVSVSGDAAYYSKSLSTFTGLMSSEDAAMVSHLNTSLKLKEFSLSAAYSGHYLMHRQDNDNHFHMLDMYISYKVKDLNLSVGYEATYSDYKGQQDEVGHGVFAIATWSRNKVSTNFIFFADPKIESRYYIGSLNVEVMKNISIYTLAGYTNTKTSPLYGLVGVKYTGKFLVGTYYILDKSNPGPVVSVGVRF